MYHLEQSRSPNITKQRVDAIHIVDKMQPPEINLTTNIKVAVSNRLKSAQNSHQRLQKSSRNTKEQIYTSNQTASTHKYSSKVPRTAHETIATTVNQGHKSTTSHKRLHSATRRRGGNPYFFPTRGGVDRDVQYGTLIQRKVDPKASFVDTLQGGLQHTQHLYKGPNFSQLAKQKRVTSSYGGQITKQSEGIMTGQPLSRKNSRSRVVSATNQTQAVSSVIGNENNYGQSNAETNQPRGSKPTLDFLGFQSIKSSIKTDPQSRQNIQNSISSECLNAQKIRGQVKPGTYTNQVIGVGGFHLVSKSGDHGGQRDKRNFSQQYYNRAGQQANQGAQMTYQSYTNVPHTPVNMSQKQLQYRQEKRRKDTSESPNNSNKRQASNHQYYRSQNKASINQRNPLNQTNSVTLSQVTALNSGKVNQINKMLSSAQLRQNEQQHLSFSAENVMTEDRRESNRQNNSRLSSGHDAPMATEILNDNGADVNQEEQKHLNVYQNQSVRQQQLQQQSQAETPLSAEINFISPTMNTMMNQQLCYSDREGKKEGNNGKSFYLGDIKKDTNPISEADLMSPTANSGGVNGPPELTNNQLPMTSAKMGPLLSHSPPDHQTEEGFNNINNNSQQIQQLQQFDVNQPGFIQAKGQSTIEDGVAAAAIRSSVVYLRDQVGNYFQMNEDLYMQLQLDQIQKTVTHQQNPMAAYSNQNLSESNITTFHAKAQTQQKRQEASSNKINSDLQTRQQPNNANNPSSLQKKASLVINLTKPGNKAGAEVSSPLRNEKDRTLRGNFDKHNTTVTVQHHSHTLSQGAKNSSTTYQPNSVTIAGTNYVAVSLKDIPDNAMIVASLAQDVQSLVKSIKTLPEQRKNFEQQEKLQDQAQVNNLVHQFQTEHKQFVQCMRNFSKTNFASGSTNSTGAFMMSNNQQQQFQLGQHSQIIATHGLMRNLNEQQKSAPVVFDPDTQQEYNHHNHQQITRGSTSFVQVQDHKSNMQQQIDTTDDMTIINNQQLAATSYQYPHSPTQALFNPSSTTSPGGPISMAAGQNQQQTEWVAMAQNDFFNSKHQHPASTNLIQPQQQFSSPRGEVSSSRNHSSQVKAASNGLKRHFLTQNQYSHLKHGLTQKAFVAPNMFKTGNKFANKSEEARFLKQFDLIIKLKHILLNDQDRAKVYTRQVLEHYFSQPEIEQFSELGIMNFQNTVKQMTIGPMEMSVRDLILSVIQANRQPLTDQSKSRHTHQSQVYEPSFRASVQNTSINDCIYNFEVDNGGLVTSLGLNSGKRLLMQQNQDVNLKSSAQYHHQQLIDPEHLRQTQAGLVFIQTKKGAHTLHQTTNVSKSQSFNNTGDKRDSRAKSHSIQGHYMHNTQTHPALVNAFSGKTTYEVRKNSRSPTITSVNQGKQQHLVCARLSKPQMKHTSKERKKVKRNLKGKKGYTLKYADEVQRQVYFNPLIEGNEVFMQRQDIPDLVPIWDDDKGDARHKVYNFLNSQNLRMVKEIEPNTCSNLVKTMNRNTTTLVSEINENHPKIKEISKKHMKDGIMRRNGLLLEHIMYDRFQKDEATNKYFTTPANHQELQNVYRENQIWPNRQKSLPRFTAADDIGMIPQQYQIQQHLNMPLGDFPSLQQELLTNLKLNISNSQKSIDQK